MKKQEEKVITFFIEEELDENEAKENLIAHMNNTKIERKKANG